MTARRRRAAAAERPVRVLYLHGLGCRTSIWDAAMAAAGPAVEPWDVELPWHGLGRADWSHRGDPAAMLAAVVADGGPYDAVVAHSFAAGLLLEAMADGRIDQVPSVLVGPFHRADPADFDWDTLCYYLTGFHRIFAEALRLDRAGADPDRTDPDRVSPDRVDADRVDAAARVLRDRVGPYGWIRFFDAYLRSPFIDLAAVTAPQLVLVGDADIATRPADAEALAAALPRGRARILADCGHFPMIERPEWFAAEVDAFLTTLPTTTRPHLEHT